MEFEWESLRAWNGSVDGAFEELCCQLARHNEPGAGARFTRKGAPDAGVECYWRLADGTEWVWQAKFFPSPPTPQQWFALDSSIEKALKLHPKATRVIVCMPQDREDPRRDDAKFLMDRWNERVEKWRGWAEELDRVIEFDYWGTAEIASFLAQEQHAGRAYFWFSKEVLTPQWFQHQVQEARANLGRSADSPVDIDVSPAISIEGAGLTSDFIDRYWSLLDELAVARIRAESALDGLAPPTLASIDAAIGKSVV